MAVKTSDTDPRFASGRVREVLAHETKIDKILLEELTDGKASTEVKVTDNETLQILLLRYKKNGWIVQAESMQEENAFLLKFEDPEQLELTKPVRRLKLNTVDH